MDDFWFYAPIEAFVKEYSTKNLCLLHKHIIKSVVVGSEFFDYYLQRQRWWIIRIVPAAAAAAAAAVGVVVQVQWKPTNVGQKS
jgi:hypothetical protein